MSIPDDLSSVYGENNTGTLSDDQEDTEDQKLVSTNVDVIQNPFHIDLDAAFKVGAAADGKWTKVTITLTGSHTKIHKKNYPTSSYMFGHLPVQVYDSASGKFTTKDVYGVGIGASDVQANFCVGGVHNAQDANATVHRSVAIIYLLYTAKTVNNHAISSTYNVILQPIEAPQTPIIIDPKVENNG